MSDYFVLPGQDDPLSSDVFTIQGRNTTFIFDAGASDIAADYINGIEGDKILVISHFHQDHTANVGRLQGIKAIYGGRKTCDHIKTGTVVNEKLGLLDGVAIDVMPLTSCHAKGSLMMCLNSTWLFVGDAMCPCSTPLGEGWNAGMLLSTIREIGSVDAQWVIPSHTGEVLSKDEAVARLKSVYAKRDGNNPYIIL